MGYKVTVTTKLDPDGVPVIEDEVRSPIGELVGHITQTRMDLRNKAIREALLQLGWTPPDWEPIETAPCDDTFALAYSFHGHYEVVDFDHDSDPAYWREQGFTHWKHLPKPPEEP